MELPAASPIVAGPAPVHEDLVLDAYRVHDAVEVEWKGSWWPAQILGVLEDPTRYRVHYDGYGDEWDEVVSADRVRLPLPEP
jgi:hypothetical protein